jgi:PHD-finger
MFEDDVHVLTYDIVSPLPDYTLQVCASGDDATELMLCDGPNCHHGAHARCVRLQTIPEGPWYCRDCAAEMHALAIRLRMEREGVISSNSNSSSSSSGGSRRQHTTLLMTPSELRSR